MTVVLRAVPGITGLLILVAVVRRAASDFDAAVIGVLGLFLVGVSLASLITGRLDRKPRGASTAHASLLAIAGIGVLFLVSPVASPGGLVLNGIRVLSGLVCLGFAALLLVSRARGESGS